MFRVSNFTSFAAGTFIMPDERGADALLLVVKGTFQAARGAVRLAKEQRKLIVADVYWGEPDVSSLKYASDIHLPKPATDVAMVGAAYAPAGRPVAEFPFSLAVGPLRRTIRVFGDRTVGARGISAAAPMTRVPLIYERAYGGTLRLPNGGVQSEPRNPVGRGFRARQPRRGPAGEAMPTLLPNLVEMRELGDDSTETLAPVGVGYVAPSWEPRLTRGGTYGPRWLEERSPFLPEDFDPRFLQAASPGLVAQGRLRGGEPVEIVNGAPHPDSVLRFSLPCVELQAKVRIGAREETCPLQVDTVLFEPDDDALFAMTWMASLPCHNRAPRIDWVTFGASRIEGVVD